jgi:hypothetical protein
MILPLCINGHNFSLEVDTGVNHTIVGLKGWRQLEFPSIRSASLKLQCYSGQPLEILGECDVKVKYGAQKFNLMMVVTKETRSPLLGLQ